MTIEEFFEIEISPKALLESGVAHESFVRAHSNFEDEIKRVFDRISVAIKGEHIAVGAMAMVAHLSGSLSDGVRQMREEGEADTDQMALAGTLAIAKMLVGMTAMIIEAEKIE